MTPVGLVFLARGGADVQAAALEPAIGRAATFVVMGGGAIPAGFPRRSWPTGSGTAYAVNAGVEALLAASDVQVIVTLSDGAAWPSDVVDRLGTEVAGGADLVVSSGARAPFSATAFTVSAWRQVGGVEEGYGDVLSDADFARAIDGAGGLVREIDGAEVIETWTEPSLRVRVRNEFIFRSRWASSTRLWAWTASQLIRTVGTAGARGQVVGGVLDGMSWRHTRKLIGRAA
jgi:heme-degrading monooxygenase HmoA